MNITKRSNVWRWQLHNKHCNRSHTIHKWRCIEAKTCNGYMVTYVCNFPDSDFYGDARVCHFCELWILYMPRQALHILKCHWIKHRLCLFSILNPWHHWQIILIQFRNSLYEANDLCACRRIQVVRIQKNKKSANMQDTWIKANDLLAIIYLKSH